MTELQEQELITIGREIDKNGSFVLLKRFYYKHGRKLKNKSIRFQECFFLDTTHKTYLEFIVGVFPQKIVEVKPKIFRIKYMSKGAISFIEKLLPYIKDKKPQAELILEYSKLKRDGGYRVPEELQQKRVEIYKKLKEEKRKLKKRSSTSSVYGKLLSEKALQPTLLDQYQSTDKNQILDYLSDLILSENQSP